MKSPKQHHKIIPILSKSISISPIFEKYKDLEFVDWSDKLLGKGAFSTVLEGTHKKTGQIIALKGIVHNEIPEKIRESQLKKLKNEIDIQGRCNHPNILPLMGVYIDDQCHVLVYKKMGEDLFDRIMRKKIFEEHESIVVIKQLLRAVNYLHSNNIIHRDIKPENILFKSVDDDKLFLADFGFSKEIESNDSINTTPCGTVLYVPNELLQQKYTVKSDIWAIGCICYFLNFGLPPFYSESDDDQEVLEQIEKFDGNLNIPDYLPCSDSLMDFMKKLLSKNPDNRLSAGDALMHPFITGRELNSSVDPSTPTKYSSIDDLDTSLNTSLNSSKYLNLSQNSPVVINQSDVLKKLQNVINKECKTSPVHGYSLSSISREKSIDLFKTL